MALAAKYDPMQSQSTFTRGQRVLFTVLGLYTLVVGVNELTTLPSENWGWDLFWGLLGLFSGASMLLVVYLEVRASRRNPVKGTDTP